MKVIVVHFLLLLTALLLSAPSARCQHVEPDSQNHDGWQHVKDQDGIDLFFKTGENGVRMYKAIATVEAFLPALTSQLMETEQYPEWMEGFNHVEVLGTDRDGSHNLYLQAHTPSFATDRDIVANIIFSETADAVIGRFTNRPTLKPDVSGYLRIPVFSGYIVARQMTAETCKITFQCEIDLGGNLPEAVADFQMRKFVLETVHLFGSEFQQPLVREMGNE